MVPWFVLGERRSTDEFWNDIGSAHYGVRRLYDLLGSPDEIDEQDSGDARGQGISGQQGKRSRGVYQVYVSVHVCDGRYPFCSGDGRRTRTVYHISAGGDADAACIGCRDRWLWHGADEGAEKISGRDKVNKGEDNGIMNHKMLNQGISSQEVSDQEVLDHGDSDQGNMVSDYDLTDRQILRRIDHTQLKPYATRSDIDKLCDEAIKYQTASVCIPPVYVKQVHDAYGDKVNICTVIGFPLGYSTTAAKVAETEQALSDGCNEIDMVVNISDVKNGDYVKVEEEIRTLKRVCGEHILKVIIETCYLSEEEKIAMCKAVTNAGADYIKTSTGFGTGGATIEDIRLFRRYIGPAVKIKAAGGVKTRKDLVLFIQEGCDRIGTSSAVGMLQGEQSQGY